MSRRWCGFVAALLTTLLSLGLALPAQAAPDPLPRTPVPASPASPTVKPATKTVRKALAATKADLGLPVVTRGKSVHVTQAPVDQPVAVVAVTVPADSHDAQVFVREFINGRPSAWAPMQLDAAGGDTTARLAGTDAYVVAGVDAVEVATVAPMSVAAELALVSSAAVAADSVPADHAWADPGILSRRAWAADETLVKNEYTYAQVTGAMIHHTAGTNTYTADQVPQILRNIQAYHVNVRGWNDIAYNVLVDRFGRAWEGRGGGVDQAVQGGHAWGDTNARTFGISLMGNYQTATPPAAMVDTMERVIAWKFRVHGVNPNSKTWGSGGQDGGDTTLNAISGHRDENATDCPGQYVYNQMGNIRTAVTQLMATTYTATGLEGYKPGNLISDATFYNAGAMTEQQVRDFIVSQGTACVTNPDGTPCLKNYSTSTPTLSATAYCDAYGGAQKDAAGIISGVGTACGINPQVLLVLIQKESGLVRASRPTASMYAKATGAGCPDGMACDASLANFFNQVYGAGERFRKYKANPNGYSYKANGTPQSVLYNPIQSCGSASFVIENQATAGLYIYTPYTANAAALDAVTGTGNACSAYGNRNFYRYMNTWFPSSPPPTAAPVYPTPPSLTAPIVRFSDVPVGTEYFMEIDWLALTGITTGYPDGSFRPLGTVNRDAMAAFLYRYAGEPQVILPETSPFSDMPPTAQFYKEVVWLSQQDITTGFPDGTFRPVQPVTRDAMAAFLYRFAGRPTWTAPITSPFVDVSTTNQFFAEISWLSAKGVTTGWSVGATREFRPLLPVARDAMAVFLYRYNGTVKRIS